MPAARGRRWHSECGGVVRCAGLGLDPAPGVPLAGQYLTSSALLPGTITGPNAQASYCLWP